MRMRILSFGLLLLLTAFLATAQVPAGFDLTMVDLDGTTKVLGRLPAAVYAPRGLIRVLAHLGATARANPKVEMVRPTLK